MNARPAATASFPFLAVSSLLSAMIVLCIGTALAKGLFPVVGVEGTTAYRIGFSAVVLLAIWRPWRWKLRRSHLLPLLAYGVAQGAMMLLFYRAIHTIPFGIAVALEFLGPFAVAVATSRRAVDFAWIALAAVGLLMILPLRSQGQIDPGGVAYALSAGACWALYIVFGHRAGATHGPGVTALGMSIAAVVVIPFGIARAGSTLLDPTLMAMGVVVATLSSTIPYSLEMVALRRLPKRTFSVLMSMEPAVSTVVAFFMLGERLTAMQSLAIAVIIGASIGAAATSREPEELTGPAVA